LKLRVSVSEGKYVGHLFKLQIVCDESKGRWNSRWFMIFSASINYIIKPLLWT